LPVVGGGLAMSARGGSPGSGDAYEVSLGVGELADNERPGGALWAELTFPAEALGLLEGGFDVGDTDVEQDAWHMAVASADAPVDPPAGRCPVHESVVA